jgi:hypothetical protein
MADIDLWKINEKSSPTELQSKAREFVAALRAHPPKTPPDYAGWASSFLATRNLWPPARNAFIFELGSAFGGVSAFLDVDSESALRLAGIDDEWFQVDNAGGLAQIHWFKGGIYDMWYPANGMIVVPVSASSVVWGGGELITYSWQAYRQKSRASGTEGYIDVYVSVEVGAKVPIIDKIITFDAKAGTKVGSKKYIKEEESQATIIGTQISKSFTIRKLERWVIFLSSTAKYKDPSGEKEAGYTVTPGEGGGTWGPFWPYYLQNGSEIPNSAYTIALGRLQTVMDDTAAEVAKHAALLAIAP